MALREKIAKKMKDESQKPIENEATARSSWESWICACAFLVCFAFLF